jgi:hypothetical protein
LPTGDGNQAMQVTVTTSVPLNLARVLTSSASLSVGATSYAEIKSDAPGCVIALSGSGTGVALTGGATLSADDCAVDSNAAVTTHACSNTITTEAVSLPQTAVALLTIAFGRGGMDILLSPSALKLVAAVDPSRSLSFACGTAPPAPHRPLTEATLNGSGEWIVLKNSPNAG